MNGVSDGWLLIGSDWYYVENGVLFGGLKTIGGATYYFDQGKMVTNARRMVMIHHLIRINGMSLMPMVI